MSKDLIRRSDAINALKSMLSDDINTSILFFWQNQTVGRGIDKIKNLPSADRPQGEWKVLGGTNWHGISYGAECSNCKACYDGIILSDYSFCPNCGARMKGADDE